MTDYPIIFSAPMVSALLEGRKIQTRRLAWGPRFHKAIDDEGGYLGWRWKTWRFGECSWPGKKSLIKMALPADAKMLIGHMAPSPWQGVTPGDRLWVRENFAPRYFDGGKAADAADWTATADEVAKRPKWTPSIHMPRWASRLTLTVTATKIERLQYIREADCFAEGIARRKLIVGGEEMDGYFGAFEDAANGTAYDAYQSLWCWLHGEESWNVNPEVVALTFTAHQQNIDDLPKDAAA